MTVAELRALIADLDDIAEIRIHLQLEDNTKGFNVKGILVYDTLPTKMMSGKPFSIQPDNEINWA